MRRRVGFAVVAVTAAMAVMPASASGSSTCNDGQVNPGDVNQGLRQLAAATGVDHGLGNDLNKTAGDQRRVDGDVKLGHVCGQLPD